MCYVKSVLIMPDEFWSGSDDCDGDLETDLSFINRDRGTAPGTAN